MKEKFGNLPEYFFMTEEEKTQYFDDLFYQYKTDLDNEKILKTHTHTKRAKFSQLSELACRK